MTGRGTPTGTPPAGAHGATSGEAQPVEVDAEVGTEPLAFRDQVARGIGRGLTLVPGIAPLGAVFGAAAVEAGLSPVTAVLLSATVFAGGAQFAAVGLLGAGASVAAAAGIVFVINSRYFLLSAAALDFARRAHASARQRVVIALGVVDESFALQAAWVRAGRVSAAGLITVSATLWVVWCASTLVDALVGARLPPFEAFGLDYALPGIFVGLFGIFADSRPRRYAGLAALGVAAPLAFAGYGTIAVLVVPPLLAVALGRWGPHE